ncbi:MAG TPA: DUF4136 domain-containing protein [Cyclobacteriaceae bacterium]|nr:DUF4136 domain-containing protein [Cyclobacteriaceae bacterium]
MKRILLFLTTLGILGACSSVRVSSDFDREANFAAYKKYAFTKEALELPVGDLNRKRILQAVTNELEAKGFTASDQPDVWIDLNVKTEQKQNATATTVSPYGTRYGYRWGMGVGFSTTNINIEQYVEGTLFVDMIDVSKKQLVWQGRGVGTIDPDADPEKKEQRINNAVKQIFTKYPPIK